MQFNIKHVIVVRLTFHWMGVMYIKMNKNKYI